MVLQCEAHRNRKKRNYADTGQQTVLANAVIPVPSGMTPPEKLRPSSGQIVPRTTKAKVKVTALLPEIGKEEAKARKVRDQVQTAQVAAKAAAVQKVRTDLAEKAEKESVGVPRSYELVARAHTIILLQPMGEAPLHLANL